jgi:hypothetical protein
MLGSHATLCGSRDSTTVDLSKTFEVGRPSISTCQALRPNPLYLFQAGRTFCIHFLPVKCHYFRSICALFFSGGRGFYSLFSTCQTPRFYSLRPSQVGGQYGGSKTFVKA